MNHGFFWAGGVPTSMVQLWRIKKCGRNGLNGLPTLQDPTAGIPLDHQVFSENIPPQLQEGVSPTSSSFSKAWTSPQFFGDPNKDSEKIFPEEITAASFVRC